MSRAARFFLSIGNMLDEHEAETACGRRGCIPPGLLSYWLHRHREEAAALIGYMA